ESLHVLVLIAIYGSQAERRKALRAGQLEQTTELTPVLELRAVDRVGEVGVGVDVHDVDHAVRLRHAAAHREADRVVAPDRHHHRASFRDLARTGRGARLAEWHIATGN